MVDEPMEPPPDPHAPPLLGGETATLDMDEERPASKAGDVLLAIFLTLSFGSPVLLGTAALVGVLAVRVFSGATAWFAVPAALVTAFFIGRAIFRHLRKNGRGFAVRATEWLILAVLPVWGLLYSHSLAQATCQVDGCSAESAVFRPFAEPEVGGLVALHALTAVAYAISRRRPEALRPRGEALLCGVLIAGAIAHVVIGIHVSRWLIAAIFIAPVFLPAAGPFLTVILYVREVRARLLRRGIEAATRPPYVVPDSPFRAGPVQEPLQATPRIHGTLLAKAAVIAPSILGLHAVIHAAWLGRADGALLVFTRTCDHVLSRIPVEVLPGDCHYLCTVAARGHAWLVRPERVGVRRGVPIVVNRQLAIANAFEDLLHERWPRFGSLARRLYDKLGLPVSRYLRRPLLADLTYLAMKPAECLFALTLLLLDRDDPERRIDRMYRPPLGGRSPLRGGGAPLGGAESAAERTQSSTL